MKIRPLGDRVLVEPIEEKEQTVGGIIIPDAAKEKPMQGKGRRVYAAALDDSAMQLGSFPFEKGDCAVIGNEGHGLSEAMLQACSDKVYIPMTGDAESLNASVAAAVLMWEICREN